MDERVYPAGWEQDGRRWDGRAWQPIADAASHAAAPAPALTPTQPVAFPPPAGPELGGPPPPAFAAPSPPAAPTLPPAVSAAQPLTAPPLATQPAPPSSQSVQVDRWGSPVAAGAQPEWAAAPPPSVGLPAAAFGVPSYAAASTAVAMRPAGPSAVGAAAPWFVLGVLVAIGVSAAGLWVMRSGGGIIWYGGYVVAFGLWRRAYAEYADARSLGGNGLTPTAGAVAVVLVLASVAGAGMLVTGRIGYGQPEKVPLSAQTVGSCFAVGPDLAVAPAACTDPAANYEAIAERQDRYTCPPETVATITNDYGLELCLVERNG